MIEVFTWGYWGWGNHTNLFVKHVDKLEAERGYDPPHFVDLRISRGSRSAGFKEAAFAEVVTNERYTWRQKLGNQAVLYGGEMKLLDERDIDRLLDDIVARSPSQRVIMFCACEHVIHCHRNLVGTLLLKQATAKGIKVGVSEWPGATPGDPIKLLVDAATLNRLKRSEGIGTIRLPAYEEPQKFFSVPWYNQIDLVNRTSKLAVYGGPLKFRKGTGWYLEVYGTVEEVPVTNLRSADALEIRTS